MPKDYHILTGKLLTKVVSDENAQRNDVVFDVYLEKSFKILNVCGDQNHQGNCNFKIRIQFNQLILGSNDSLLEKLKSIKM